MPIFWIDQLRIPVISGLALASCYRGDQKIGWSIMTPPQDLKFHATSKSQVCSMIGWVFDSAKVVASNVAPLEKNPQVDVLAEMIFAEFKLRLPELLLMRVDKITMSNSIEARVPFLDHELVDASFGIPLDDKIPASRPKHLFKKAMAGIVPDQILNSQKRDLARQCLTGLGRVRVLAEDILFSSSLMKRGYFNLNVIRNLFRDHKAGRRDNALYLWSLINLVMWYDYWIDGGASAEDELQT